MNRTGYRALLGVAIALAALSAHPVAAQTTFWACRVPNVGVLYMIADGAANCLDGAHVKFSWTDGGAPPDGSITTVKLADDAVTSAKITNGTIATADLANASVTTAKLAAPPAVVQAYAAGGINNAATYASMGSVTIVAPTAGRVLVFATGNGFTSNKDTLVQFGIGTTGTAIVGSPNYAGYLDAAAGTQFYFPISVMETFNVAAGSSTFHLNLARWGGTGQAQIFDARIRAIFLGT